MKAEAKENTKSDLKPLILVSGNDEYFVTAKAKRLAETMCPPEQQAFGLDIVDGAAGKADEAVDVLRRTIDAIQTVGFLQEGKLVWLKGAGFFSNKQIMKAESVKTALQKLVDLLDRGLPPGQSLLISAGAVNAGSKFFKVCDKQGQVFVYKKAEKTKEAEAQAEEMIRKLLARENITIRSTEMKMFLERVETDTRQIAMEVEKLALYVGAGNTVSEEAVDLLISTSRETMIWTFTDAVVQKKRTMALRVLKEMLDQKQAPIRIVSALEQKYTQLLVMRGCLDKNWAVMGSRSVEWNENPELERCLSALGKDDFRKWHPFRTLTLARQSAHYKSGDLEARHDRIIQCHEKLVSSMLDPVLLLDMLILELAA